MDSRRLSYTLNSNDKNTIYNEDDNASIYFDPCISKATTYKVNHYSTLTY